MQVWRFQYQGVRIKHQILCGRFRVSDMEYQILSISITYLVSGLKNTEDTLKHQKHWKTLKNNGKHQKHRETQKNTDQHWKTPKNAEKHQNTQDILKYQKQRKTHKKHTKKTPIKNKKTPIKKHKKHNFLKLKKKYQK